jgi:phosphoribosylpyrophosphate synthetase
MELLVMIDALKRGVCARITGVCRITGYARQDRKVSRACPSRPSSWPICWRRPDVDRVLALDLHAGQIQGFFNVPVDHLFAAPVMIDYLGKKDLQRSPSSCRPTRAVWSARGRSPSGSTPGSPSSTSGARVRTSRWSCT